MTASDMLSQYEKLSGRTKILELWQLFLNDAEEKMARAVAAKGEELRLIFHSLRSSSLVFDMTEFAQNCREIEEKLLAGGTIDESDLAKSKEILKNNIQDVIKHFNAADEND